MITIGNEKQPEGKNDKNTEKSTQNNEPSEMEEENAPKKEEEDYAELKEQLLRLAAEFDNYKKRVKKDIDASEKMGKAALMQSLLPIVDEFELAMLALEDSKESNLTKGISMLYSNLMDVLKKDGLRELEVGKTFDPYKNEIIVVKESDEKEGTILEIVKKGYLFGDRMIRPAAVIIAKGKEPKKEDSKEKTE